VTYSGPPFGWTTPPGYTFDNLAKCASCGADIAWHFTAKANRAPLNADGVSHFATCPSAALHRKPPTPKPEPRPVRTEPSVVCRHTRVGIAAATLMKEGAIEAFDAVYTERCPRCGTVKRNTRLAATIWTLRHTLGWDIDTDEKPGKLAVYRLVRHGTMPDRMP
jgi:hypothetical protein